MHHVTQIISAVGQSICIHVTWPIDITWRCHVSGNLTYWDSHVSARYHVTHIPMHVTIYFNRIEMSRDVPRMCRVWVFKRPAGIYTVLPCICEINNLSSSTLRVSVDKFKCHTRALPSCDICSYFSPCEKYEYLLHARIGNTYIYMVYLYVITSCSCHFYRRSRNHIYDITDACV